MSRLLGLLVPVVLCSSVLAASPPAAPTILEPERNGQLVSGADVHMVTGPFSDPDGDAHRCTDWEIRLEEKVAWSAPCVSGPEELHIHLADGTFADEFAAAHQLPGGLFYTLRARHRDDSGDAANEWSAWSERIFRTSIPSSVEPMRVRDILSSPPPRWTIAVATGETVVPPIGAELRLELPDGVQLLQVDDHRWIDAIPAPTTSAVRVVLQTQDASWTLPESEISFEDDAGVRRSIYLPALTLEGHTATLFWVSNNGSTYVATPGERAPNFGAIARAALVPWTVLQRGFVIEHAAGGFQLPVNIAFVPNPGESSGSPMFYVAELYGSVKVVTRAGEVRDFATGLLDFDPTGHFPGSGESGLAGIAYDEESGDLFVTMVSWPDRTNRDLVPRLVRLRASEDGLSMAAREDILVMPAEKQSASHQISNVTIGPDRKLYVHMGDSLRPDLAQKLDAARGKILRVNMDGTAPDDNPFYDAADGITPRDYVFAMGFRNPFGGAWRAEDHSLYSIENGPTTDRMTRIVRGRNYGWDGTDESMQTFAIATWTAPAAPVQMAWVQRDTFGGSGFPASRMGRAYVTESGPTWASGPQASGKQITELVLSGEELIERNALAVYNGTGKATAAAIAAGPDGLYFSDLYKDEQMLTPIDRGANLFRIRWIGYPDFDVRSTAGSESLEVRFVDDSEIANALTWRWDFGDGSSSSERNPVHRYAAPGTYTVRMWVDETQVCTKEVRVGAPEVLLRAEYFADADFSQSAGVRLEPALALARESTLPFSVRWSGTLSPRFSERYRFEAETEGDVRVIVGDQVVISGTDRSGELDLEAGLDYGVTVEYRHTAGSASVRVTWQSATQEELLLPRATSLPRRRGVR